MTDFFENFSELSKHMTEGVDYQINYKRLERSQYLIIAPHGGKIERGTSEVAKAIAANVYSFYAFEGLRQRDNSKLHITSHVFNEPRALELARETPTVLGIHGRSDARDKSTIYLGGLDTVLVDRLGNELKSGGFEASACGHDFPATHSKNICNRGRRGKGAQLELPLTLRCQLIEANNADLLARFADAVRRSLSA